MGYVPLLAVEAEPIAVHKFKAVRSLAIRKDQALTPVSSPSVGVVPRTFQTMRDQVTFWIVHIVEPLILAAA